VVYYHGGGFVLGNLDSHHSLCSEIAAALDLPVVSVDYRLAPEHPCPAAPDDCEAATRWLAGSPDALGRAVTGLIQMGDSAGGNLAIVTTRALLAEPAAVPVVVQVPIYPATDGREDHPSYQDFGEGYLLTRDSMDWFFRSYAGEAGNPRAFPIHGDHERTPPTVLVTAGLDPIRDGGRAYAAQLVLAGTEVVFLEMAGTIHGFVNVRKILPSAQADLEAILAAIRLLLARGG
ncbi:MAG: alpha/beta hydrolase, partial [Novosphingobium sp.]